MTPASVSSVAGSNKLPLWLRWSGLAFGVLTLAWLPVEDISIFFLTLLSLLWSAWMAGWLAARPRLEAWLRSGWWAPALLGAAAGLLSAPVAVGLLILKAGLHAHGFMDLSLYQLTSLLARTPMWAATGGVVGGIVSRLR